MIVLDTNVISEAMKPAPAPAIRAWLDKQAAETPPFEAAGITVIDPWAS